MVMESVFSFAVLNDIQNEKLVEELNVILDKVGISLSIKPVNQNSSLLNIQIDNTKFVRITNRFAGRPTYIDDLKQKVLGYLKSHTVKEASAQFQIPERTLYRALKRWKHK